MIYVDESFQGSETILCAVKVKAEKCKIIIKRIRDLINKHKIYGESEIKLNKIKIYYSKAILKSINKKIKVFSEEIFYAKNKCFQHTQKFYNFYYNFLSKLKRMFPNEKIIIDKFSGHHKIQNFDDFEWHKSAQQLGLQIADIAIYSYAVSKDILKK